MNVVSIWGIKGWPARVFCRNANAPGRAMAIAPGLAGGPRDVLLSARCLVPAALLPVEEVVAVPRRKRVTPAPPPPAIVAARQFVAWMQVNGWAGQRLWRGADGIWEFYLWHCHFGDVQPVPDNVFGEALDELLQKGQARDRSTGKLQRLTYYVIPEPAAVVQAAPVAIAADEKPKRQRVRKAA